MGAPSQDRSAASSSPSSSRSRLSARSTAPCTPHRAFFPSLSPAHLPGAELTASSSRSRLVVAASEQGFFPRTFAAFNSRQKTPINGILLSTALSTIFICFGDFGTLTLFYGVRPSSSSSSSSASSSTRTDEPPHCSTMQVCAWTWNLAVVIGLLVLRVTEPTLKRCVRLSSPLALLLRSHSDALLLPSTHTGPTARTSRRRSCSRARPSSSSSSRSSRNRGSRSPLSPSASPGPCRTTCTCDRMVRLSFFSSVRAGSSSRD